MDRTAGQFTTGKLQVLLDCAFVPTIRSRRDLAAALAGRGESISVHGVEAWFRHVDSNYNLKRPSLTERGNSYALPTKRWQALLALFDLPPDAIGRSDVDFRKWCLQQTVDQADSDGAPQPIKDIGPPIGQDHAWRELVKGFDDASKGSSSLLLLTGPSGVGKTQILDAFRRSLPSRHALQFRAICAKHTDVPLIPIMDMFRNGHTALIQAGERFERRFRQISAGYLQGDGTGFEAPSTFVELMTLVGDLAQHKTVVLFVDDLHLADEATGRFLDYLWSQARARAGLKLLIVAAYRGQHDAVSASNLIASLERMSSTRVISLQPLARPQLEEVLNQHLNWPIAPSALRALWQLSFGRPTYALELLNLLRSRKVLFTRNGQTEIRPDFRPESLPSDLQAMHSEVVQSLSASTAELLQVISAVGIEFSLETIQKLRPKWSLEFILTAIDEAESQGLLIYERDRYRFRNAHFANLLYRTMGETMRARLHLEIANLLRDQEPDPSDYHLTEIAHHLMLAKPVVDGLRLCQTCREAAYAAAQLAAWPRVIQFARIALEGPETIPALERGRLLRLIASAWHQSGHPDDAIHYLSLAFDAFRDAQDQTESARTLNELVRIRGNFDRLSTEGDADVEALLSLSKDMEHREPRLASRLFDAISARMMYRGDHSDALHYGKRALSVLDHDGPSIEKGLAQIGVALGKMRHMNLSEATRHLEDAQFSALQINDPHTATRALQRLTLPLLVLGRLSEVEAAVERMHRIEQPWVRTGEMSIPLSSQVSAYALRGKFTEAREAYQQARALIDETGYFWSEANLTSAFAYVLLKAGDPEAASELIAKSAFSDTNSRKSITWYPRYLTLITAMTAARDFALPSDYKFAPPPADAFDIGAIAKYCVDVEVALASNDRDALETARAVLQRAYSQGARFSLGWPFCIGHLIARAMIRLGQQQEALYYLLNAYHNCTEIQAAREAQAIRTSIGRSFPQVLTALNPYPALPPATQTQKGESHLTLVSGAGNTAEGES